MKCPQCTTGFKITPADEKVHQKMNVPLPTLCPDCRNQRRMAIRNDQNYYKNSCHLCKRNLISMYSPDKPYKVLCPECYWSDKWNALDYGREFDFNRPFFEQFEEMRTQVPRLAIFNTQSENSEFTVHSSKNRNCYMGSSLINCEDVHYSDWAMDSKDSMDLLFCTQMDLSYECIESHECTLSNYLELCTNVTESFFAFDCKGSTRLIGCASLRNRKNHILNQTASKEECLEIVRKLKTDAKFFADFKKKYETLKASLPKRDSWMVNAENCSGNYIVNSKNAHNAYDVENIEDGRYIFESIKGKDIYDVTRTSGNEMLYECKGMVDTQFAKFSQLVYQCDNMAYCDNCQASSYCFGCMSLKQNKFCILNKQYSESDYKELVPKIIEHMKKTGEYGEFFPVSLSAFGYNETKAQEFYPLTKTQVEKRGWKWSDYEQGENQVTKKIPASRLPEDIKEIPDDILNWAIEPEDEGKPFKIIPQELKFYRMKGLPIPHLNPKQRHLARVALQNPRKLYDRQCDQCQKAIQTTYAPDRPEKIYCEECYLKTVY